MGGTTSVERGSPAQKRGGTASKGRGTSGKDEVSPEFKRPVSQKRRLPLILFESQVLHTRLKM